MKSGKIEIVYLLFLSVISTCATFVMFLLFSFVNMIAVCFKLVFKMITNKRPRMIIYDDYFLRESMRKIHF